MTDAGRPGLDTSRDPDATWGNLGRYSAPQGQSWRLKNLLLAAQVHQQMEAAALAAQLQQQAAASAPPVPPVATPQPAVATPNPAVATPNPAANPAAVPALFLFQLQLRRLKLYLLLLRLLFLLPPPPLKLLLRNLEPVRGATWMPSLLLPRLLVVLAASSGKARGRCCACRQRSLASFHKEQVRFAATADAPPAPGAPPQPAAAPAPAPAPSPADEAAAARQTRRTSESKTNQTSDYILLRQELDMRMLGRIDGLGFANRAER